MTIPSSSSELISGLEEFCLLLPEWSTLIISALSPQWLSSSSSVAMLACWLVVAVEAPEDSAIGDDPFGADFFCFVACSVVACSALAFLLPVDPFKVHMMFSIVRKVV